MDKIEDKKLESIIRYLNDSSLSEDACYFELGIGLMYEYAPEGVHFSADYVGMGMELWGAFQYDLYGFCCESTERRPKEWVSDLIEGNIRDAIVGIVSAITAKYNVSLGIAIPITSIILKKGVIKYCSKPPIEPEKSVKSILSELKKEMNELKKQFESDYLE